MTWTWLALQNQVFDEGVGYYNGTMFSPEGRGANCARLCFGHPTADHVAEGVAELARIFEEAWGVAGVRSSNKERKAIARFAY